METGKYLQGATEWAIVSDDSAMLVQRNCQPPAKSSFDVQPSRNIGL